jgi:hypothetical protein
MKMKNLLICTATAVAMISSAVSAQPIIDLKPFDITVSCAPVANVLSLLMSDYWNERPLFTAITEVEITGVQDLVLGKIMTFVNQDTGTGTVVFTDANGISCIITDFSDFEPYSN